MGKIKIIKTLSYIINGLILVLLLCSIFFEEELSIKNNRTFIAFGFTILAISLVLKFLKWKSKSN